MPSAITTRAERQGADYVLNGVKQFITSGKNADVAVVFAVTDKAAGKKGISAFVVPTDAPATSSRASRKRPASAPRTPRRSFSRTARSEQPAGPGRRGYRIALANLESGRINVAAQATGVARAALEAAIAYARERKSMGKPLIEHQAVNFRLADMATQVEAARQLYLHAARAARRRQALPQGSVDGEALRLRDGREGVLRRDPDPRRLRLRLRLSRSSAIWRDVRVTKIYEGANDIQRLVIGSAARNEKAPIDFYFDFSSPTATSASQKIEALAAKARPRRHLAPDAARRGLQGEGRAAAEHAAQGDYAKRDFLRSRASTAFRSACPTRFPPPPFTPAARSTPRRPKPLAEALFKAYFVDNVNIGEDNVLKIAPRSG